VLVDKIGARLPSWKGQLLNRAGRLAFGFASSNISDGPGGKIIRWQWFYFYRTTNGCEDYDALTLKLHCDNMWSYGPNYHRCNLQRQMTQLFDDLHLMANIQLARHTRFSLLDQLRIIGGRSSGRLRWSKSVDSLSG
jgi:hypothetical protein